MEPRVILIKPSYLPALPTYEATVRQMRFAIWSMPFYSVLLIAAQGFRGGRVGAGVAALVLVPGVGYLMWGMARGRSRTLAEMAGEQPIVSAAEIDGGFELRPNSPRGRKVGLPVFPGDTIVVTVERSQDRRRSLARTLPFMEWRFANEDFRPLVVRTYFDADRALLRDVENRLKGLGATVEITHTPFEAASA